MGYCSGRAKLDDSIFTSIACLAVFVLGLGWAPVTHGWASSMIEADLCSTPMTIGTIILNIPAYPIAANVSIGVYRDGVLLSPLDMTYFPNETLSLTLVSTLGEFTWETGGGAYFIGNDTGCPGNVRSANEAPTIVMPADDVSEVTIWGGHHAAGELGVGIMRTVTLLPKVEAGIALPIVEKPKPSEHAAYFTATMVGLTATAFQAPAARMLLAGTLGMTYSQVYLIVSPAGPTAAGLGFHILRSDDGQDGQNGRSLQSAPIPVATDLVLRLTNLGSEAEANSLLTPVGNYLSSPLANGFAAQYRNVTDTPTTAPATYLVLRQSGATTFSVPALQASCILDVARSMALSWKVDPNLDYVELQLEGAGQGWISGGLVSVDKLMVSRPRHKVLLYDYTAGSPIFISLEGYLPKNLVEINASTYGVIPLLSQGAGGKLFMRYHQSINKANVPVDLSERSTFMWAWAEGPYPEMHNSFGSVILNWRDGTCEPPLILPELEGYWLLFFPFLAVLVTWTCLRNTRVDDCGKTLLQRRLGPIMHIPAWLDWVTCGVIPDLCNFKYGELLITVLFYLLQTLLIVYWALRYGEFSFKSMGIAFGKAAMTNLMLCYLPVNKTSLWTYIFGISFERAVKFHRHLSYLMLAYSILHLGLLIEINPVWGLPPKLNGVVMAYGLWALIAFLIMTVTALLRRWHFELFRYTHYLFIAGTVLTLLHVPKALPYMWMPCLVHAADFFWRWWGVLRDISVAKLSIFPDHIAQLDVFSQVPGGPKSILSSCTGRQERKWTKPIEPGSYVFVCIPRISPWQWHPISISTAGMSVLGGSAIEPSYSLHVKGLGDGTWTDRIYRLAASRSLTVTPISEDMGLTGSVPTFSPGDIAIMGRRGRRSPTVAAAGVPVATLTADMGLTGSMPTFSSGDVTATKSPRTTSSRMWDYGQTSPRALISPMNKVEGLTILVDGPYGKLSIDLSNYRKLVLVAGGIGITPMTTTLSFISHQKRHHQLPLLESVILVWAVRNKTLVDGFIPFLDQTFSQLNSLETPSFFKVELYVSIGSKSAAVPAAADAAGSARVIVSVGNGDENSEMTREAEMNGASAEVEKREVKQTIRIGNKSPEEGSGTAVSAAPSLFNIHYERPDIARVMEGLFGEKEKVSEEVGVLVCASKALLFEVQRQCVRWDVDLHAEEFAW
ncbi:ferric reductase [Nannochloropsis oceanica]